MSSIQYLLGAVTLFLCSVHLKGEVYNFGSTILGAPPADSQFNYSRVYLLPNYAISNGFIFAFSTVVKSPDPAIIILYRPQSKCNTAVLKPVGQLVYYPSVPPGWRENVYLESFFQDGGCMPVMQNDVIGLYFPTKFPSILYSFRSLSTNFDTNIKCKDGLLINKLDLTKDDYYKDVTFDNVEQPFAFEIEVFYYTSAPNSGSTTCQKGVTIPSNKTIVVRPSTTTPNYKGVIGLQGLIGLKGPTGFIGIQGDTGKSGDPGEVGEVGPQGYTGATGQKGLGGLSGDTGSVGLPGLSGAKGLQGANGSQGDTGFFGDVGEPGFNLTVDLKKKNPITSSDSTPENMSASDYFGTDTAIWALFIWLAILSFTGLLTFALLIALGVNVAKL